MPAKEIKELRKAGKLDEALKLAKEELDNAFAAIDYNNLNKDLEKLLASQQALCELEGKAFDLDTFKESIRKSLIHSLLEWPKRNISWVYYDYLKQNCSAEHFDTFLSWINQVKTLQLPPGEEMFFEQISWQVGKIAFNLAKENREDHHQAIRLFESVEHFCFPKNREGYSFLFKGLHKALKESGIYTRFADWWDFSHFMAADFEKDKLPDGKEVMAIAEQAYIAYAKHLLPKRNFNGEVIFDREKAEAFLPNLIAVEENHPGFQYPAYFIAKLLLALGDKENMLAALLPFAKKKRNDFWVWEILSEAFTNDPEKVFACYCKALSCKSPEEMLVGLRQRMAALLGAKDLFNEAKTEIELLEQARLDHGYKIPGEVLNWQAQDWYKNAISFKSNFALYRHYLPLAESILFSDIQEEMVIVEFVNSERKILNFIASDTKYGFFKYERFFRDAKVGDVLNVRFNAGTNGGLYQVYTAVKIQNMEFKNKYIKQVSGSVRKRDNQEFGFIDDVFIQPKIVKKQKLIEGSAFSGEAIKSYNSDKKTWGWKIV